MMGSSSEDDLAPDAESRVACASLQEDDLLGQLWALFRDEGVLRCLLGGSIGISVGTRLPHAYRFNCSSCPASSSWFEVCEGTVRVLGEEDPRRRDMSTDPPKVR